MPTAAARLMRQFASRPLARIVVPKASRHWAAAAAVGLVLECGKAWCTSANVPRLDRTECATNLPLGAKGRRGSRGKPRHTAERPAPGRAGA